MKHTKFVVSSFENRNGNTSWRVDGYFNGVRIRKNFKTREPRLRLPVAESESCRS